MHQKDFHKLKIEVEFKNIGNTNYMPYFMLLSIKDDRLIISRANMFGGFKKYFASFELSKLKCETEFFIDLVVKIYKFNIIDNENYIGDFFLIVTSNKDSAEKLVNYIKEYNK